jgi:peroxiredoxin
VDLQRDKKFMTTGVALLSISPDPVDRWRAEVDRSKIDLPVLSDPDNRVADSYGVMQWAMGSEPGHTFVLIGRDGKVTWIRDYGAIENGGLMYVVPKNLLDAMEEPLRRV